MFFFLSYVLRKWDIAREWQIGECKPRPEALPFAYERSLIVKRVEIPWTTVSEYGLGFVLQSPFWRDIFELYP